MRRSYAILLGGASILIIGNLLGNAILNLIVTYNPAHSSLIKDANYHMLWWSNSFLFLGKLGIIILILGGLVFFMDRRNLKKIHDAR